MKSLSVRAGRVQRKSLAPQQEQETPSPHSPSLSTPSTQDIVHLQQFVGNRGVQRLLATQTLQREGTDTTSAPGPLKPGQVFEAITWYKSQPQKYTSEIISKIQTAVGTSATGKISPVDAQAVAEHQKTLNENESPVLTVDGKAGPRTLPTVFKQGLAQQEKIEGFVAASRLEVFEKWTELSAEERIRGLAKEANKHLKDAGVPETELIIGDAAGNLGQFDFTTWSLDIGKPAFENDAPTADEQADMADTMYHESRHCEQWFRMAQLLAGQGQNAKQIMKKMSVQKQSVADAAVNDPLEKGSMEALIAEGWYDSVYGAGAKHRGRTLKELAASTKAHEDAETDQTNDPSPENEKKLQKAVARRDKALKAYFELPEENDAWHVGGRVTTEYKATEPEEEATL